MQTNCFVLTCHAVISFIGAQQRFDFWATCNAPHLCEFRPISFGLYASDSYLKNAVAIDSNSAEMVDRFVTHLAALDSKKRANLAFFAFSDGKISDPSVQSVAYAGRSLPISVEWHHFSIGLVRSLRFFLCFEWYARVRRQQQESPGKINKPWTYRECVKKPSEIIILLLSLFLPFIIYRLEFTAREENERSHFLRYTSSSVAHSR